MSANRQVESDCTEIASMLHDQFSRLTRQLRNMQLPQGMTPERLSALSVIDKRGPISVTALADKEMVRPATMSRMVSALVDEGSREAQRGQERRSRRSRKRDAEGAASLSPGAAAPFAAFRGRLGRARAGPTCRNAQPRCRARQAHGAARRVRGPELTGRAASALASSARRTVAARSASVNGFASSA